MNDDKDTLHFEQVWPPPGARTLAAIVTKYDTRDGWVRVTWLEDGRIVVQGAPEELVEQVPDDRSEASILAWARGYGFATIHLPRSE